MDDVYFWLAERYENERELKQASKEWAWLGSILLPLGGVPFLMILVVALNVPERGSILSGLLTQIPSWLPLASYFSTVAGLAVWGYAVLLRRAAARLSRF